MKFLERLVAAGKLVTDKYVGSVMDVEVTDLRSDKRDVVVVLEVRVPGYLIDKGDDE